MTCPDCGLLAWPYDEKTVTCKAGHRTTVGEVVAHTPPHVTTTGPALRKLRYRPGTIALAACALVGLNDILIGIFT